MTWLPLESKMFTSVAYDQEKCILYLRFRSGDVYRYFGVLNDGFRQFLSAESKGRYFLNGTRNCFRYERMARLQVA
jgi:hypothetical protein